MLKKLLAKTHDSNSSISRLYSRHDLFHGISKFVSGLEFSSHNRVKLGCFQISGNRLRSCTFRFWITRKNSYGNFLRIWTYHNSFCNTATLYEKMSYNEVLEDNRSDNLSILKHQEELIPKASTETSSAIRKEISFLFCVNKERFGMSDIGRSKVQPVLEKNGEDGFRGLIHSRNDSTVKNASRPKRSIGKKGARWTQNGQLEKRGQDELVRPVV